MKKVCKQAGIKVPPNIYRVKPGTTLEEAFDALLDKYDLTQHSSSVDIGAAAKKLQKERDLEGGLPSYICSVRQEYTQSIPLTAFLVTSAGILCMNAV